MGDENRRSALVFGSLSAFLTGPRGCCRDAQPRPAGSCRAISRPARDTDCRGTVGRASRGTHRGPQPVAAFRSRPSGPWPCGTVDPRCRARRSRRSIRRRPGGPASKPRVSKSPRDPAHDSESAVRLGIGGEERGSQRRERVPIFRGFRRGRLPGTKPGRDRAWHGPEPGRGQTMAIGSPRARPCRAGRSAITPDGRRVPGPVGGCLGHQVDDQVVERLGDLVRPWRWAAAAARSGGSASARPAEVPSNGGLPVSIW